MSERPGRRMRDATDGVWIDLQNRQLELITFDVANGNPLVNRELAPAVSHVEWMKDGAARLQQRNAHERCPRVAERANQPTRIVFNHSYLKY